MTFAGTTIYVDDSNTAGPWNGTIDYPYQYIQDGIDAATAGDTIVVAVGTYDENVDVNKPLTLTGASSDDVTVGVEGEYHVFNVTASSVTISGFTVNGANVEIFPHPVVEGFEIAGYAGIYLSPGVTDCNIHDNILTGNVYGILLLEAENTVTSGNNMFTSNNATYNVISGIEMQHTYGNTFASNNAISNGKYGITLDSSRGNTFTDNTANSNDREGFWLKQGQGDDGSSGNIFTDNTANSNTWSGVHMTNLCGDSTYTGNTFNNNSIAGMNLGGSAGDTTDNLVVNSNTFSGNPIGILIDDAAVITSVVLRNNNIMGNTNYGIDATCMGTLDAAYNYWGDISGPYHPTTNPNGLGDSVSDNVEFVPWIGYYSWSVLLNIEEQYGVVGDTVIFGEKPDALDGEDDYDAAKQPIPPIPYVYAWFDAGLPEPYDMLWEDYRDYPDDYESWDLYMECNTTQPSLASVNLVVSWNTTDINATEYDHIRLYDASDVLLADMKATSSYVFSAEFEYLYHFQIRCSMNVAPTAYNDFYTTGEDVTLTVPSPGVLGNDEDVENTPLIALLESDVSNGILTLNADGSFEYTPSIGFYGDDSFTYKANDGIDNSTLATVTITMLKCHQASLQQYWNLMSLPVSEPVDKTQIVIRSGGTDYTWSEAVSGHIILDNLYGWDTTTQCYAVSSTFKPGRAYWMWAYVDCELLIYSNDVGTGDITTIQMKWNLVGFPYDTSLVKENLVVHYDGVNYSWDEATTNDNPTGSPIVLKFLYGWERTSQRYAYADSFDAGEGYWMYAYKTCNLINPLV